MRSRKLTMKEIVHDTAVNSAQPKARVDIIIEHFLDTIAVELAKGRQVRLHNFGTFYSVNTPAAGRRTVKFRSMKRLKDYVSKPYTNMESDV